MHPLVEDAKEAIGVSDRRDTALEYSGRFSAFNGNIRADRWTITVRLSKEWRGRDKDAQQGIVEYLLAKVFRKKIKTPRMALYQDFLLYAARLEKNKRVEDDVLQDSFDRVNKKYFGGEMEKPNIIWGRESHAKLGHYHYGSDTVLLSTALGDELRMLDFVMYHELLHKKHGLTPGGRAHTKAFRADEAKYEEATQAELEAYVRKHKRRWF